MSQQAYITPEELRSALASLPRVSLAQLPTPLEECPRLSGALSPSGTGPRIFIKRDDLTGQALGGNKVRHLEFRVGDALARGCDTYIYADKANAARATAAACAKVGMRCLLIVPGHRDTPLQGNLLLAHMLGAELVFLDNPDRQNAQEEVRALEERLRQDGRKPYPVQQLPAFHLSGVASYLEVTLELEQQLREQGIDRAHFYLVNGHSHVGLQLGAKLLGLPWRVTGVAVGQNFERDLPLADWSRRAADHLGLSTSLATEEIDTTFDYEGPGYGVVTEACVAAIKLAASTESIILDPAYTGKAMAALIDHIRQGKIAPDETVVFIHTGGIPILFESAQELSRDLAPSS